MTELQYQGAQAAIDILAAVAPAVVVLVVGGVLIKLFVGFIKGRY